MPLAFELTRRGSNRFRSTVLVGSAAYLLLTNNPNEGFFYPARKPKHYRVLNIDFAFFDILKRLFMRLFNGILTVYHGTAVALRVFFHRCFFFCHHNPHLHTNCNRKGTTSRKEWLVLDVQRCSSLSFTIFVAVKLFVYHPVHTPGARPMEICGLNVRVWCKCLINFGLQFEFFYWLSSLLCGPKMDN